MASLGRNKPLSPARRAAQAARFERDKAAAIADRQNDPNRMRGALFDMTPAQFQANLWMGAGDVTGLADESQGTFMELLRRGADKRAGERGVTRKQQLLDLIHKRAPLAVPAMIGTGGLMGMVAGEEENGGI